MYDERYLEYVELFNERAFYDCHEVLEDLWLDNADESRRFYQGLIHLAAAYLLLFRGNKRGSLQRFTTTLGHLSAYPAHYEGLDVESIRSNVNAWLLDLQEHDAIYSDERVPKLRLTPIQ